jgi:4-amino-4-deoxy-L-arabinose transferase-like glycosyltransferase
MSFIRRFAVLALFVAAFVLLATVRLERPGYNYDEVIFVPVSLRVLGQCDVDAAVTREWGCLPLMQRPAYVGAVKAWLHAPIFAAFGINPWTVRLPSILIAAAALVILWSFARRELGGVWAMLLLALIAIDPVLTSHARLDWGPQMLALLLRVTALAAVWRWLQTGRFHWLAAACGAMLVGFADKLSFLWVIGALLGATVLVAGRVGYVRLRDGAPWQPALAAATGALLLWGTLALVPPAAPIDALLQAGVPGIGERIANIWRLYALTFSGNWVLYRVFGTKPITTALFGVLVLVQLVTAAGLLWSWRPWTPARRFLAFLTATLVLLFAAIVTTPHVSVAHHLFMLWPLPTLHLVTLLAIVAQHAGGATDRRGPALRRSVAVAGVVVCGALLAWNVAWQLRYVDAWRNNRDFRPRFDAAIAKVGARIDALDVERVVSLDRGLHAQLVALAGRGRAAEFREWTGRRSAAAAPRADELRRMLGESSPGRRVAFVLHGEPFEIVPGARERLQALLRLDPPCGQTEESIANAAGKPMYVIVVADYGNCAAGPPG